jgi:DNA-binding IclR family transcriptional regulator
VAGNAREAGISVTSRALAILGAFGPDHPVLSLSDIARRTGIPPATTHRLLGELEAWGALIRGADGRYLIGLRLWELGSLALPLASVRDVAMPYLQWLYEVTREDVYLAVPDGSDAVFVEYLGTRRDRVASGRRALRWPLAESAAGLALLTHQECVQECVRPGLRAQLAEIRRRGCAVLPDHDVPQFQAIAVPLVRDGGGAVAAIGLCGPTTGAVLRWRETLLGTVSRVQRALARREALQGGVVERAVRGRGLRRGGRPRRSVPGGSTENLPDAAQSGCDVTRDI